jgi:transcriptional regulator of met regulon
LYCSPEDDHLFNCPVCQGLKSSSKVTKIVSIADKVAEILSSEEIRNNLIERHAEVVENVKNNTEVYGDIFDGQIFKDLYNSQAINTDPSILNIYLKIDVDGFTSSSSHSSMIMIHAVVLNLDSSER